MKTDPTVAWLNKEFAAIEERLLALEGKRLDPTKEREARVRENAARILLASLSSGMEEVPMPRVIRCAEKMEDDLDAHFAKPAPEGEKP